MPFKNPPPRSGIRLIMNGHESRFGGVRPREGKNLSKKGIAVQFFAMRKTHRRCGMIKKSLSISAILLIAVLSSAGLALDNEATSGARKVEGGVEAIAKSAGEIGTKAVKAVEGAAKDTAEALRKAWENIVKGVKDASR